MRIRDTESFWTWIRDSGAKILIRDPGAKNSDPGSGREKSDPVSDINIPDPQHWLQAKS